MAHQITITLQHHTVEHRSLEIKNPQTNLFPLLILSSFRSYFYLFFTLVWSYNTFFLNQSSIKENACLLWNLTELVWKKKCFKSFIINFNLVPYTDVLLTNNPYLSLSRCRNNSLTRTLTFDPQAQKEKHLSPVSTKMVS